MWNRAGNLPSVIATFAMNPDLPRKHFDDAQRTRLQRLVQIDLDLTLTDFTTPEAASALDRAEILITSWGCPPVDELTLAAAPNLKAIIHAAGTVKHIVTEASWRRGIVVSSSAAANATPVAEYTVAMIVLANKRAFTTEWGNRREDPNVGSYRTVVGLVGASFVGREVIRLLASFDMDVVLSDPTLDDAAAHRLGVKLVELDELVATSDVVSIHAPNIPATHHLIDDRRLAMMKDGATLINTARGILVDTEALAKHAGDGRIHAILDVTEPEPLPDDHRLRSMPNVTITPHIAGAMGNELRRLGTHAVDEVERFVGGVSFSHPVREDRLTQIA